MEFSYHIKTAPTDEPVALGDLKTHLRITSTDEDGYLRDIIKVARQRFEDETGRCLLKTTWTYRADELCDKIYLHKTPVKSVTHIKYRDADDVEQTLATASYRVDIYTSPARIEIIDMPTLKERINAVEIEFIAGEDYDVNISEVHKHAIKLLASEAYQCRDNEVRMKTTAADHLINNARVFRYE